LEIALLSEPERLSLEKFRQTLSPQATLLES
jgi:hypothetical protein